MCGNDILSTFFSCSVFFGLFFPLIFGFLYTISTCVWRMKTAEYIYYFPSLKTWQLQWSGFIWILNTLVTALFIIARTWKQPRCPSSDEWIRKLCYIYPMEYYSAIKKNTFESVLIRWMKLEPIIQSVVSQKEKHQSSILMHIYGI